ncbi:MAG: hypothetical protein HY042_09830 [Spirochaetia bacterium]|nr:hypothetical protein [Spirochaetia bacterium]
MVLPIMEETLQIVVHPGTQTELKDGVNARWQRGHLNVEMRSDLEVAPGPPSLAFYEQILPVIYGATFALLAQPIAKFTVDRAKQALYWETHKGQRLYVFPRKGQSGKICAFETWIE